ncbi:unnamed protein product [Nippostrongylus brasiliensis]|uniref:Nucleobase-ascorbate transporter 1 n=1 Tax=Nippostrongylus brasiliensis TaxID=27835 RepID=A0A158R092_NIPBR|nr:unnamed protein product [Nippostrongylus brasiliensis]
MLTRGEDENSPNQPKTIENRRRVGFDPIQLPTETSQIERDQSMENGKTTRQPHPHQLHFTVNHVPDLGNLLLFGFQQMMLCLSGLLVVPFLLSNFVCAGSATIELRVRLIAASFVSSGIATILQTTFGLRLCILHGPSFAFIPPLIAFAQLPENRCTADMDTYVAPEIWTAKILTMQGSLLIAVTTLIFMGATGLVGILAKMIGPITITPLLLLLTISFVPTLHDKMSLHWISVVAFGALIATGILFENVLVSIPYYSFSGRSWRTWRARLFGQFPYLIAITVSWLICLLLTVTEWEPPGGEARTDKNHTLIVLAQSPWFQIPYPGQFGIPRASVGLTLAIVASCIVCIMESLGDYQTCARVSHQSTPPSSSVNRAIIFEGVGSAIAAMMGLGTGVTTYAENIAVMHVTKVVSRSTMQVAGVLLILAGLFTKCAAFLAAIPDAVVGGLLGMGMAMITGVALSNLQSADLRLSRNITIMGTAILVGLLVPRHVETLPLRTGLKTVDECLNMLLKISMLVGGLVAFILDNTVSGATREQRGFIEREKDVVASSEDDGYALSEPVRRFLLRHPALCKLPFLPSSKSLRSMEDASKNSSSGD